MPAHSDDEPEIAPGSEIATYSLGATRTITFTSIHSSKSENLDVLNNSLYTMTRKSQAYFKHAMIDVETTKSRYSLTMRCVDTAHLRSTIIVGDSNTKPIEFGEGRGKIGERYPGKREKAARIANISPSECAEYQNVVIVCGTNDLRPENNPNIVKLSELMISKVIEICKINPNATVYLMPVLPTRDQEMNRYISSFNRSILQWVRQCRLSVIMPNVSSFLDSNGLLASALTRGGDPIHLGNRGLSKFVSIIKSEIFRNYNFLKQQRASKTSRVGARAPT